MFRKAEVVCRFPDVWSNGTAVETFCHLVLLWDYLTVVFHRPLQAEESKSIFEEKVENYEKKI